MDRQEFRVYAASTQDRLKAELQIMCCSSFNNLLTLRTILFSFLRDVFHFERAAADMQVALGIWDLDSGNGEMLVDQVIQVASEPARPITHFAAPGNELEIDSAVAKFFQKRGRLRIIQ